MCRRGNQPIRFFEPGLNENLFSLYIETSMMTNTIHEAAAAIRTGKITPLDLVEECLAKIDRWESTVRAWVFVDRDYALAEAKRLTDELKRGQNRGPLHGIPIGIKDIFDVYDWPTAAGSKQWSQCYARKDAEVVRRLREAGANFLGKTVTTQYASFDPPMTRNPWNLERTPGGSSSGSAVAIACGMCLGALGSQTGGSIIRPASYCGVAGCKPSYGFASCEGVVPLAESMDHPGPMASCVADLALLLQVIAEPGFWEGAGDRTPDFHQTLLCEKQNRDRQMRTVWRFHGLFRDLAEPAVVDVVDSICEALAKKKAALVDMALPSGFANILERHRTVMAVEAAAFHRERFLRRPEEYQSNITKLIEEGLHCPATFYKDCKEHQRRAQEDMAMLFHDGGVAITPATTSPAPDKATTGDPAFNSPWSYLGLPTVSIPTGQFIQGLPISVQLISGHGKERELMRHAAWLEWALGVTPLTPEFLPAR